MNVRIKKIKTKYNKGWRGKEGRKDGHLEVITERKGAIPEEGCTPFTVSRVRWPTVM